jgi:hypothetical protein
VLGCHGLSDLLVSGALPLASSMSHAVVFASVMRGQG